jgi:hypothetical protein
MSLALPSPYGPAGRPASPHCDEAADDAAQDALLVRDVVAEWEADGRALVAALRGLADTGPVLIASLPRYTTHMSELHLAQGLVYCLRHAWLEQSEMPDPVHGGLPAPAVEVSLYAPHAH